MDLLHKNNNPLYSAEHQWKSPQKPSFTLCNSFRTLKFSSVAISAVNPEGPHVPLMMLSRLHPNRWTLKTFRGTLLISVRALCHKQLSLEDDTKIKSLSLFAEPLHARPLTHVSDHLSIRGTAG